MVYDKTIKIQNKKKKGQRTLKNSRIFDIVTNDEFENPEIEQVRADTIKWFKDFEEKCNQEELMGTTDTIGEITSDIGESDVEII